MSGQIIDQIGERGNAEHRNAVIPFDFLYCGELALAPFLEGKRAQIEAKLKPL